MSRIRIASGIAVIALASGFFLMEPISSALARYLIWRLSPAAAAVQGRVRTEDATIHYVCYGSGPSVLLLHGGLSNRLVWFSQIPWLVKSGRQVVVMDTRGHGESGLGDKELNYQLLASDAIHVMDKLHIQQTDVIGWSDGGNTALLLARYWPERIQRLVSISANFSPSGLKPEALDDTYTHSSGLGYWFRRWWTGAGQHLAELETRIMHMWRTYPVLKPEDLREIEVPVLVIVGDHDIISLGHEKSMVALLPKGVLDVVPGGHATPVTQSVQVNKAIAAFLGIPSPD